MDTLWLARHYDLDPDEDAWHLQRGLMNYLESAWQRARRGPVGGTRRRQHFVHSKVLAWVAADRATRTLESWPELGGPVERYRALRAEIFDDVCAKGFDADRGTFTQYYGSRSLDAALLLIPQVGFLPAPMSG